IGALYAHDDGSQTPDMVDGKEIAPGDLFLDKGTRLTYNQEFSADIGPSGGSGFHVQTWISDF
ncbi:MAG: hypothetical protein KC910_14915, partial [Candidatus Eremiobacteraeota bacterium]|nr:hypothetical protein [Candidatus Eremiobacteraeota bacterium]